MALAQLRPLSLEAPEGALVRVPFIGRRIAAGFPSPADDFLEEALALPRWLCPNPAATFLWRIGGTSMIEAGIHDGDIAVVDRAYEPINEDIVVAIIGGEPTLKRYLHPRGQGPQLAFANGELAHFAPDPATEIRIWGVVTLSLRLHRPLARA